jgi:hypothetical protein
MPGEGEIGCFFDEISNLVEPIERPAMGEQHCGERRHRKCRLDGERRRKRSETGGLGRLAMDGVVLPNGLARRETVKHLVHDLPVPIDFNQRE